MARITTSATPRACTRTTKTATLSLKATKYVQHAKGDQANEKYNVTHCYSIDKVDMNTTYNDKYGRHRGGNDEKNDVRNEICHEK